MIYDITQPLFECEVFPGDTKPEKITVQSIEEGDVCNLSDLKLCAHNGTHVDAPLHFYQGGKGIDQIPLTKFIGLCYVAAHDGDVTAADAQQMLEKAKRAAAEHERAFAAGPFNLSTDFFGKAESKILIKGKATVTLEAAKVFARAGIDLVGNESQTVGPEDAPMAVHLELLKEEVVLLEGIRLSAVPEGVYLLNCAPINLKDTDGSPCRAILMEV